MKYFKNKKELFLFIGIDMVLMPTIVIGILSLIIKKDNSQDSIIPIYFTVTALVIVFGVFQKIKSSQKAND